MHGGGGCVLVLQLTQAIAENVLSFNEAFWLRLAYRTEACRSEEDRNDLGELATVVMNVVERLVKKTEEKMDDSSSILQRIMSSAAEQNGDFVVPMTKDSVQRLRQAIHESSSRLDESLLAQVGAWMRKLENGPESERRLLPVLQRFYQLYAARALSDKNSKLFPKRQRPDDEGEKLLVSVITADEEEWESLLLNGLVYNPNMVVKRFFDAILRREDRVTFQLESGSYAQRIISEYLSEIEERAKSLIAAAKEDPKKPPLKE
ncbi:hypothetical protein CBR_g49480 [Chara braunii]|uniref:Uncharacterized protein n=1 Tax=Chara braunii TaxID=69332 RepID=A0A388K4Z1_CHABU|nr:hypothetical protein CBR_g49480 [Chara braunii]|eukprot:GBG65117.1 hypothetical protein CBR_g49480 [Chara braunii]